MDIQSLRMFLGAADCRSFTRAAERFYIAQPAFSRRISRLECELETKLFNRENYGVSLTSAGEVLQREARRFIEYHDGMIERTRLAGDGISQSLNVATVGFFGWRLPVIVREFQQVYSDVQMRMELRSPVETYEAVRNRSCDLGITLDVEVGEGAALPGATDMHSRLLFREGLYAVASAETAIAQNDQITIKELTQSKLILLSPSPPTLKGLLTGARARGVTRQSTVAYDDEMHSIMLQVCIGMGVTIVPGFVLHDYQFANLKALAIEDMDTTLGVVAIWRKDSTNPSILNFLNIALHSLSACPQN